MNTLYFVKFRDNKSGHSAQAVFLVTAKTDEEATAKGFEAIAEPYRHLFDHVETTAICTTPDTIERFEPC